MPAVENGHTLAGVASELKDELKEFAQTRMDMLRLELHDKLRTWKLALPLAVCGLVLLATGWLVLTGTLVALIATAFYPSRFAYFFAFLIVAVAYLMAGVVCAGFAYREMKQQGVVPHRTIKVLKDDAVWLQTEARSQL